VEKLENTAAKGPFVPMSGTRQKKVNSKKLLHRYQIALDEFEKTKAEGIVQFGLWVTYTCLNCSDLV
jgi:hypothetical protein